MAAPEGFTYDVRGDEVHIKHHGARAAILRGARASEFLEDAATQMPNS